MIKRLNEITTTKSSSIKLSDTRPSGTYPVYGASDICGYLDNYQVEIDSIAIVKDGAGIGRIHYMSNHSSVLSTMQIIIPNKEVKARYLYYLMKYMNLGKQFNGATIPHIYYKNYSKLMVNVHSKEEQSSIIRSLSRIEKSIDIKNQELISIENLIKSRFIGREV